MASDLGAPLHCERRWLFGNIVVWETQRRVQRGGGEVRLGSRSFDLLLHLVKRAGEVVSKNELLSSVWSNVVVEEATVRVHMSFLRKALGAPRVEDGCREWIVTVPLRGYCFVGRVRSKSVDDADLLEPNVALGQGVVEADALEAHRRRVPRVGQAVGDGQVFQSAIRMLH